MVKELNFFAVVSIFKASRMSQDDVNCMWMSQTSLLILYELGLRWWKTRTPFYIENPRGSLFMAMPEMQLLATLPGVQKVRHGYCIEETNNYIGMWQPSF